MAKPEDRPVGRRPSKLRRDPEAIGAHTVFWRHPVTGRITHYTTFDAQGGELLRFRATGRPHGGLMPPLVLERRRGKGAGAKPKAPRRPRPDELPSGIEAPWTTGNSSSASPGGPQSGT